MSIEIGSKWVHIRTGNRYEIIQKQEITIFHDGIGVSKEIISYKDQQGEIYVRTEKHFLDSFKPTRVYSD